MVQKLDRSLSKVEAALAERSVTIMLHEARKAIKEYRALLRLIDTPEAKQARRAAADAARSLSSARDRQACRDAVAALLEAALITAEDAAQIIEHIGPDDSQGVEAAVHRETLQRWLSQAHDLHGTHLRAQAMKADISRGLREAYLQARKVRNWEEAEHLHDLRKRVVVHRYQMSFFAAISGGRFLRRVEKAQKLREILGGYQDLETLKQFLADRPAQHVEVHDQVIDAGRLYQGRLLKQARRLHEKLFHRKPVRFGARVRLEE
ncbi:CHAD domain-containing protein [Xanthobacter sp. DSM 24535]|uniref:CHAD domain-containing protein n=1 Tax=Roseixanthobacter psychrophilus TaxID=3119917 RepID=UPI003727FC51